jgi:hypothetical protein
MDCAHDATAQQDGHARRRIRRSTVMIGRTGGAIALVFSAICTFLAIAPEQTVGLILEPRRLASLQAFAAKTLSVTAEQWKWILALLGDLTLAVAVFLFLSVHYANKIARTYAVVDDFETKLKRELADTESELTRRCKEVESTLEEASKIVEEKLVEATKKEVRAQKLHRDIDAMLTKIRGEKENG